jgi:hypothetical protein
MRLVTIARDVCAGDPLQNKGRDIVDLVEPPRGPGTSHGETIELKERRVREIDGISIAAHALIDNRRSSSLTSRGTLDCNILAAVWVAV